MGLNPPSGNLEDEQAALAASVGGEGRGHKTLAHPYWRILPRDGCIALPGLHLLRWLWETFECRDRMA